jgi:hypothetical protein
MNPPLRNDQHPLLAKTVPTQSYVELLFAIRLAVTRVESAPCILTQTALHQKLHRPQETSINYRTHNNDLYQAFTKTFMPGKWFLIA